MQKKIVLVVDDMYIFQTVYPVFQSIQKYHIISAKSKDSLSDIISENEAEMIILCRNSSKDEDLEILSELKKSHPDVMRILMSKFSSERINVTALRLNLSRLIISIPIEQEELEKQIDQLFETEEVFKQYNVSQFINSTETLPTIKPFYQRILALIESNGELLDIAKLIEQDQSIAAKVLHVANSAFYSCRSNSVRQAVAYLGLNNVREIVLSTSVIDELSVGGAATQYMNFLWKHSFITNKLIQYMFEEFLNKKFPDEYSSAGLLHNIGTVFLLKHFSDNYIGALNEVETNKFDLLEVETYILGLTHSACGAFLLKWWDFPFSSVEAALYHHTPFDENIINKELITSIHIAENFAWEYLGKESNTSFDDEAFESLKINKKQFTKNYRSALSD